MNYNIQNDGILIKTKEQKYHYYYNFAVIYREKDPNLVYERVIEAQYNLPSWKKIGQHEGEVNFLPHEFSSTSHNEALRTKNIFEAGEIIPISVSLDNLTYQNELFLTVVNIQFNKQLEMPSIDFTLIAKKPGYFSVMYLGSEEKELDQIDWLWQPLIWQEKSLPHTSYVTPEFNCPIPAVMYEQGGVTSGILVDPSMMKFNHIIPTAKNSKFAVLIRSQTGKVKPMVMAPLFGGEGSYLKENDSISFKFNLFVYDKKLIDTFQYLVENKFQFRDLRKNVDVNLNKTFDNMVDYCMDSYYNKWASILKGCSYQTDVPGTVKNVSVSHPLALALLTDRRDIFKQRVIPLVEYMISRKNVLFATKKNINGQGASHQLGGPCTSVTDLCNIYTMTGRKSNYLYELAIRHYHSKGERWQDALAIFKMTNDKTYLAICIEKARQYIKERMIEGKAPRAFFWTAYAPLWQDLLELYEQTKIKQFLDAAIIGAKQYCMYIWFCPVVPAQKLIVNVGGKAPKYWYSRAPLPMEIAEEEVEAWRVSEIGLTCEASGTGHGHRGIFMTFHAPSLLRLAHYANEPFFEKVARSSVVGRYQNFPGYHMNSERTTVYEKYDYPYHEFEELSYNTFHYGHALAMSYMLMDYLVADVFKKSNGFIHFDGDYYEGYAYVYNKIYGHKKGHVYGQEAYLYMPNDLLHIDNYQINYLCSRNEKGLLITFTNQSNHKVSTTFEINHKVLNHVFNKNYKVYVYSGSKFIYYHNLHKGKGVVEIPESGLTTIFIKDLIVETCLQKQVIENKASPLSETSYCEWETEFGNVSSAILMLSEEDINLYAYCHQDEEVIKKAKLVYTMDTVTRMVEKNSYPFEFSIPIKLDSNITGYIEITTPTNELKKTKEFTLK